MTKVKICGIRQLDHALAAAQAGADYIGLVFVPQRHRRVEADAAREIVSGLKASGSKADGENVPRVVGLFAGQPVKEVNNVVKTCGLDLVQLCGAESLEYAQQMKAPVIKVVHVPGSNVADWNDLAASIQAFRTAGHLVALDRQADGLQGGTGQNFDWDIAAKLSGRGQEFFLAGGLTPDNVARAVAQVHPWGVDVSSGVETDGEKDPDKIRAFVENAKQRDG